jgi:hypothetical protein
MPKLFRATILVSLLLTLCLASSVMAQSGRGTLTGTVKDPTGAVAPGTDVVATNMETGVQFTATTTQAGIYRLPYVPPGKYRMTITLAGFKKVVRENIDVAIAQTLTVDFTLEIGQISDSVTVEAGTPLLESSSPEIGTFSTEKEVHTWPIMVDDGTRQLQTFIFKAMPGTEGNGWAGSINGGQQFSHEILIDGVSVGRFDLNGGNTNEFTPTIDAVSEFKLQTGAVSSQYGNTQTGLANFGLKSGTNAYHGSAFWFHQNSALNANSWSANLAAPDPATGKAPKATTKLNNWGVTAGGPVVKDRTFFFFSFEQNNQANYVPSSSYDASPTADIKRGDFSRLFDPAFTEDSRSGTVVGQDALGRNVIFGQIYDPLSTQQLPNGTWIRDPFPGNIIPENRWSAVSTNILNPQYMIPDPTFPRRSLVGETMRRNTIKISGCCPEMHINNTGIKIDQVVTQKHKLNFSFTENDRYRLRYGYGGTGYFLPGKIPNVPAAGDKLQATPGQIVRLAEDWTISPTMLNHFGYGYNRFSNNNDSNSFLSGEDWAATLGLQNVGTHSFPQVSFTGPANVLSGQYKILGHQGSGYEPNGSSIILNDFTWIKSRHSFRIGFEHRRYYINSTFSDTPGSYTFDSEQTGLPNFRLQTGFAFSSFMLGAVRNSGTTIHGMTQGVRSRTTALYLQDDWKVTDKLTLNLGIRWDIPTGFTNPNNMMSALDPTMPNPGADGYPGALAFLGDCPECNGKTRWADLYYGEWSPRVGFAYSPSQKMVLRGGFGINYAPPLLDGWAFGWFNGFDGSNVYSRKGGRAGGGNDPSYFWDNPYKQYTGALPNYDPTQLNGNSIPSYPQELNKYPKVYNWNFGIQYELPWQVRLEANYVGTRGTRLQDGYKFNLDQVDPKYLSLGDALLEDIGDHPEIQKPYASYEGTVGNALKKFPQYYSVGAHRSNGAWSNYHSLQMTATKRTSHGLSFLVAYTFSKALATGDDVLGYYGGYGQTIYNRALDYSVTSLNYPNDLRITWIYDLPFGPEGRWLKSGFASYILGGWTVSAIQNYRSGSPLGIGNGSGPDTYALRNSGFYVDRLLGRDQMVSGSKPSDPDRANGTPYLNSAAWGPVPTTENNVALRLGTGVRFEPNLRGFSGGGEDFSLIKRTRLPFINEAANFEIRADILNLFNRTWISDPNTDIGTPEEFGRIFSKYGGGRTIQLGARITF